ncbi:MAG TPA: carboxylating nicotinate-nucleotide diphosphorylase [Vicinamibacterales bacterium]|nr:carboxylating nicotinate-nucleotide diphosphorylase [Acidobacteriota bacterium]HOC19688.1 carboxylating nicotinate-nucleotide diphosphorylase [Vicinamibacterales bacterium]
MSRERFRRGSVAEFDEAFLRSEVRRFLEEDVGPGDATTRAVIPPGARASGWIVARQPCVVAGLDLARAVFEQLDPSTCFEAAVSDGEQVPAGARLARLEGLAAVLLTGERLALNLLQRLSGVATVTRRYVEAIAGTGASVSDTRKTTPGLRLFEKRAVSLGGGRNHRLGLHDGVLIKDNHVAAAGGVGAAVRAARAVSSGLPIQVEVDSLEQLEEALDAGADAVLLDNMTPGQTAAAVARARAHPRGADCWIESSGGITLQNVRAYAEAGVDTISVGALTHSAPAVDIALDFE